MPTKYRTCPLCEAMCGLALDIDQGRIKRVYGDEHDSFSQGYLCPKGAALKELHEDPHRFNRPRIRSGTNWRQVSWQEAFEFAAEGLATIHKRDGANAVGVYNGNPSVHNYGILTHGGLFYGLLKTKSRFSATSIDQLPHHLVSHWLFGHQLMIPIPDVDRTQFMLMLGANPIASNGSIMSVPNIRKRLRAIQARGGQLVVLDPRRSETATIADEHHFIRPGTDAAFLAAFLHTLFDEGLADPDHLAPILADWQQVVALFKDFSPEALAAHTGMEASTIRRLARAFQAAPSAVCYGRMGVSTQAYGTLCQWMIQLINIATGNLDRPGGALFPLPAADLIHAPNSKPGHFGQWSSRVRGLPEFNKELPVSALAEEILHEGEGRIRALVTTAGNPVLTTPNGRQLERALDSLDFMVSIDPYLNETTRFAQVILPSAGPLYHDHFDLIFHHLAVRNTVRYDAPIFEKPEGCLDDWEIFEGLAQALAPKLGKTARRQPPPARILDQALQHGPYGAAKGHPQALTLEQLKDEPHRIDLGPLQPQLPDRLYHADGNIHCLSAPLMTDLKRFRAGLANDGGPAGLLLIGRRHLRTNNSWMNHLPKLGSGKSRCLLLIHPQDLQAYGLTDGTQAKLQSRVGIVEVTLQASDEIMQGVVSLPHGWGHRRQGFMRGELAKRSGSSVNDVTDETYLDGLSGNAAVNGLPVQLLPVAQS